MLVAQGIGGYGKVWMYVTAADAAGNVSTPGTRTVTIDTTAPVATVAVVASASGATPDGERHGVRGLYITDGAALPTALGVNPQETIMAVSTVLAGRIVARHAGLLR
jgi:hypothetical protein